MAQSDPLEEVAAATPCPLCREKALQVEYRPGLYAKPIGTFSLAGGQMKVSAHRVQWPWLVCRTPDCGFEEKGKLG